MKTLYININGEDVQSTDSIEVIGRKEDSIAESFYIFLGTEILSGSHVRGISQKAIVCDFPKDNPDEFQNIESQWNNLKEILLGDNPTGDFDVVLPSEYLHWLHYSKYAEVYEKKFQGLKEAVVTIDVEELYEDSVDSIKRKVIRYLHEDNNAANIDEFVVNDCCITRKSKIVSDIRNSFNIPFKRYKKNYIQKTQESLFPILGVELGKTSITEIEGEYSSESYNNVRRKEVAGHNVFGLQFQVSSCISTIILSKEEETPHSWERILPIKWGMKLHECERILYKAKCKKVRLKEDETYTDASDAYLSVKTSDGKYLIDLYIDGHDGLLIIAISLMSCPKCSSHNVEFVDEAGFLFSHGKCKDCEFEWNLNKEDIEEPAKDYVRLSEDPYDNDDYWWKCRSCGHIWLELGYSDPCCPHCSSSNCFWASDKSDLEESLDDEEDYEDDSEEYNVLCPNCKSKDVKDDGSDYLQYECKKCGFIWGNEKTENPWDALDGDKMIKGYKKGIRNSLL